ncbi:MAG: hypothetical protein EZS28_054542, partial [Streblomastix strix]
LANLPRIVFQQLKFVACLYVENAAQQAFIRSIENGVYIFVMFVLLISFLLIEYIKAIKTVKQERRDTFLIYLLTPKPVIKQLLMQLSAEIDNEQDTMTQVTNRSNVGEGNESELFDNEEPNPEDFNFHDYENQSYEDGQQPGDGGIVNAGCFLIKSSFSLQV